MDGGGHGGHWACQRIGAFRVVRPRTRARTAPPGGGRLPPDLGVPTLVLQIARTVHAAEGGTAQGLRVADVVQPCGAASTGPALRPRPRRGGAGEDGVVGISARSTQPSWAASSATEAASMAAPCSSLGPLTRNVSAAACDSHR